MNRPRLPATWVRVAEVVFALAIWIAIVERLLSPLGWIRYVIATVVVLLLAVFRPDTPSDSLLCATCSHRHLDHHGNCQECLRVIARGDVPTTDPPCWRFDSRRPRSVWGRWRAGRRLPAKA